jgi:hypothetical protein
MLMNLEVPSPSRVEASLFSFSKVGNVFNLNFLSLEVVICS